MHMNCHLHLNPGANVGRFAPLFKCKVPFGKARGTAQTSKPPYEPYTREIWLPQSDVDILVTPSPAATRRGDRLIFSSVPMFEAMKNIEARDLILDTAVTLYVFSET